MAVKILGCIHFGAQGSDAAFGSLLDAVYFGQIVGADLLDSLIKTFLDLQASVRSGCRRLG